MNEQKSHIDLRVSQKEKETIDRIAAKCALSTSEYLRQRALGFAPRAVPPEPVWRFCEVAGDLLEKEFSSELHNALLRLIRETTEQIIAPGKDRPEYVPRSQQRKPKVKKTIADSLQDDDALMEFDPYDYSDSADDWEAV